MLVIARRFEFDMGHRVWNHEGKCRFPHGHRYAAEVHLEGDLDNLGRIMDYGEIKQILGGYIDRELDHGFAVYQKDEELIDAFDKLSDAKVIVTEFNPTAENLARWLAEEFHRLVPMVKGVTLYETPNCKATYGR